MTLGFTGDIGFSKYFKDAFNREDFMSDTVINYLADTDYTVANVEGAVSAITSTATKLLVHANHPDIINWLPKINGKVWNLANNHTNDCGPDGVVDTLSNAAKSNCLTVGLGNNVSEAEKPLYLQKDDVSVGFVAASYAGEDAAKEDAPGCIMWDDHERIKKQIQEVKKNSRWCVMIVHAGVEFAQMPLPYIRNQYKKYLQYGADIVVGHHPHVVQNYETFGDKMIFYSLGNFVFDTDYQRRQKYTDSGMLIKIHFTADKYSWEYMPIKIDRTTQTVQKGECPKVFCDINKSQYALLWPYAARDYRRNRRQIDIYVDNTRENWTEQQWRKFEIKGCRAKGNDPITTRSRESRRWALWGDFLANFNLWRLSSKKEVIDYLK